MNQQGIETDFSKTTFNIRIRHYTFYFSSRNNMERFADELGDRIDMLRDQYFEKFKLNTYLWAYWVVQWYRRVERRGFRIVDERNGDVMICPQEVEVNGNEIKKYKLEN